MEKARYLIPYLLLGAICAGLFIPGLGNVHLFDWDEINFAESAREMLVTGNYSQVQIDYQPFEQKPPLFFWMQALSMKAFGVNEFAARFPNAVCGIITILIFFHIGYKRVDARFGLLWILMYLGSFLPHFYFKSGIIDPWFNLFMFLGIWQWATLGQAGRWRKVMLSGLFIGLAVLTKGPVGLLLPLLTLVVMSVVKRSISLLKWKEWLLFILVFMVVTFAWYGVETIRNGLWFLQEFVVYQIRLFTKPDAGHGGPFYYHFIVLLLGCFPASIFMIKSLYKVSDEEPEHQNLRQWMIALLCVVLMVFSIVTTKIVHYSSLAYFPITFLAAYYLYRLLFTESEEWSPGITRGLLLLGVPVSIVLVAVPIVGANVHWIMPYVKDAFARGNLDIYVAWPVFLSFIGLVYLFGIISGLIAYRRTDFLQGVVIQSFVSAIAIQLLLYTFVPRIEKITQRTAIEFYKSIQDEDCYVEVLDFKSYAHLFYTRKEPPTNPLSREKDWLLHGEIDKPVYFVVKNIHAHKYRDLSSMKVVQDKYGFVVFKRVPF